MCTYFFQVTFSIKTSFYETSDFLILSARPVFRKVQSVSITLMKIKVTINWTLLVILLISAVIFNQA